jgi:hypothetical protein
VPAVTDSRVLPAAKRDARGSRARRIKDPQHFIPGNTMTFASIKDARPRAEVRPVSLPHALRVLTHHLVMHDWIPIRISNNASQDD